MYKIGTIIISLLLVVSINAAESGNPVLDSLVNRALSNNPLIKAAKFKTEMSNSQAAFSGVLPDPQISVGFLNLPKGSLNLDETPMSGVQFGLSQTIPWPGKLSAISDIAELETEHSQLNLTELQNRITRLVNENYFEYTYWQESYDIVSEYKSVVRNIIDVAQVKYANGQGSFQDVLKAETSEAKLENRLESVKQNQLISLANLSRLTDNENVPAAIQGRFSEILINNDSDDNGSLYSNNPTIAKADVKVGIAEKRIALAKSNYYPNFRVGVDYRIRKEMMMDAINGEDFLSFKVGFNLPLWFSKKQKNQNKAARFALNAAQSEKKAVVNKIENSLFNTRTVLNSLMERINQYDDSILPKGEAAAEAARVAYEVGQVDFNGYLQAHLALMDIQLERWQLVKQFFQQKAKLNEILSNFNNEV